MPLTDKGLRFYDSNILRLPDDKRTEYHGQVDRLIKNLTAKLTSSTNVNVTKVVKAGSFAKYTILRKTNDDPVDVDLVFYIEDKKNNPTLESLIGDIGELLMKQYPTKSVEDFKFQPKAATINFTGSGLSIDVVPVLEDKRKLGFGKQYDLNDGSIIETCAKCQIEFIQKRKNSEPDYRTLVRLAKRWRNHMELKQLKSYAIELILAYLVDKSMLEGKIEYKFLRFLQFIAQSELSEKIYFSDNSIKRINMNDPVVIIDPYCSTNNVASRITHVERQEIVNLAEMSWETAHYASVENDNNLWKDLFGPRFKTED